MTCMTCMLVCRPESQRGNPHHHCPQCSHINSAFFRVLSIKSHKIGLSRGPDGPSGAQIHHTWCESWKRVPRTRNICHSRSLQFGRFWYQFENVFVHVVCLFCLQQLHEVHAECDKWFKVAGHGGSIWLISNKTVAGYIGNRNPNILANDIASKDMLWPF